MYMIINPLNPVIIFYPKNDLNTVSNLCVQKHAPHRRQPPCTNNTSRVEMGVTLESTGEALEKENSMLSFKEAKKK